MNVSGWAFLSANGGPVALSNTSAINVAQNSVAQIFANVSGAGTISIGDRSAVEIGGSVAASQGFNILGRGLLTFDNPASVGVKFTAQLHVQCQRQSRLDHLADRRRHFGRQHRRFNVDGDRRIPELLVPIVRKRGVRQLLRRSFLGSHHPCADHGDDHLERHHIPVAGYTGKLLHP